jgi:hypothetical protein
MKLHKANRVSLSQPHCDLVPPWAGPAYDLPCRPLPRWLPLHVPLASPHSPFVSDRVGVVRAYLARVAVTGAPRVLIAPAVSLVGARIFRHPPVPPFRSLIHACYCLSLSRRVGVRSGSHIVVSSSSV